jgi:hypothetical protein
MSEKDDMDHRTCRVDPITIQVDMLFAMETEL